MQAITISIDSKFNFQLRCPLHPLQGVISYCLDEACNLPLCILCIASHCQAHFMKGTQPKLEDAGKLFAQLSEALQSILKKTEDIRKTIATYEGYVKQERVLMEEMEQCKQNMHNLIEMVFEQKIRSLQEDFFSIRANLNSLEKEAGSYYTQLNANKSGAQVIHQLLRQNKVQELLEDIECINQKTAIQENFSKSYKVIVELDSIKQRVKEALEAYVQIYEEKTIFEIMNNISTTHKTQDQTVQNEMNIDIEKKLEDIKNQLMCNLGDTKPKKIYSESLSNDEKIKEKSLKSSKKSTVCKRTMNKKSDATKKRTPFAELQNIIQDNPLKRSKKKSIQKEFDNQNNSSEFIPSVVESESIIQEDSRMSSRKSSACKKLVKKGDSSKNQTPLFETHNKIEKNLLKSSGKSSVSKQIIGNDTESKIQTPVVESHNQILESSLKGSRKPSICEEADNHRVSSKMQSPVPERRNIDVEKEDGSGTKSCTDVALPSSGKNYTHENSFLNQYANSMMMEEEWPAITTNTPSKDPIMLDPAGFKSFPKFEAINSKKMEQEYQIAMDTNEGALDLPNENSFIPFRTRTSFDSLSQETYGGSDSKNSEIRDFFSIEQFATDRESETLSRAGSVTKDFDMLERRQIIERIESDFSIKANNDLENEKIGFLYYFQWRSKLLHLIRLDQVDNGIQHPRFETHKLNIDFLIPDYHASILLPNKKVHIVGGQSLTQQGVKHKETYQLNLEDLQVSRCADLLSARDSHSLTYCDGFIYALGGIISNENEEKMTQKHVTERCERYDIQKDCWSEIKPMEYPVCNQCSCVFNKKYIFTFGGRTSSTKLINKIFRYTIATDSWLTLHMKPADRIGSFILTSQACCRQINSKHIFVFGGYSEERNISNQSFVLEVDDETSDKGRRGFEIKYINKKRLIFAAPFWEKQPIIHNNKLYCLQNIITHSNPKLSYCVSRRVLCFDGKKWSSVC